MARVCVIGGGEAGVSAAESALAAGAEVTLLERAQALPPARRSWSSLLSPGFVPISQERALSRQLDLRLGVKTLTLQDTCALGRFDSTVMATGSVPERTDLPGHSKEGVHVLSDHLSYLRLGLDAPKASRVWISGGGLLPLQIAGGLAQKSQVGVFIDPANDLIGFHPSTFRALLAAALESNVTVVRAAVQRAAGLNRLEAVLAGNIVYPCDLLALVPRVVPNLPRGAPVSGGAGGVLVGSNLETSYHGVFAAGSCAEIFTRASKVSQLCDSPCGSGRIAGTNAAGSALTFSPSAPIAVDLFDLRLVRAGPVRRLVKHPSPDVEAATVTPSPSSSCTLFYDRTSGRILGGEAVGRPNEVNQEALALAVSTAVDIQTLARDEMSASTDISLLAEAAWQGLSQWRRS